MAYEEKSEEVVPFLEEPKPITETVRVVYAPEAMESLADQIFDPVPAPRAAEQESPLGTEPHWKKLRNLEWLLPIAVGTLIGALGIIGGLFVALAESGH